jgi:hemerythrin
MAYLNWNENLQVNVPAIDEQHQELIRLINELHDAMAQGRGTQALAGTIESLIDYTRIHFREEERRFESSAYPNTEAHKKQHRDFVDKVTDFQEGFAEGRLMLSLDVMDFLSDWLVKHIQGVDKTYEPYIT